MFWGVTLDSGKRYTQTVEKSFHLSMAALGFQNYSSVPVTVMVEVDKAQFALCTLQPGKIPQQPLDYCFTEGEEIVFFTEGPGEVHLTGYLMEEPSALEFEESTEEVSNSDSAEDNNESSSSEEVTLGDLFQSGDLIGDDSDDEDEESGDMDWDPLKDNLKRKKPSKKKKKKKQTESLDENNIISLMDVEQAEITMSNDSMDGENEDGEGAQNSTKSENELKKKEGNKKKRKMSETEHQTIENGLKSARKLKKKGKKTQLNLSNSDGKVVRTKTQESSSGKTSLDGSSPTKTNDTQVKQVTQINKEKETQPSPGKGIDQTQAMPAKRKMLPGGTVFEDITKGTGPLAKKGQMVHVYYKGNLAKSKKQFDACLSGRPFSFRVGAGEVVQGWDLGVTGMQVGGKRRLIVPPSQGYGNKKMGPIPANSTLEFEVQLVKLQ